MLFSTYKIKFTIIQLNSDIPMYSGNVADKGTSITMRITQPSNTIHNSLVVSHCDTCPPLEGKCTLLTSEGDDCFSKETVASRFACYINENGSSSESEMNHDSAEHSKFTTTQNKALGLHVVSNKCEASHLLLPDTEHDTTFSNHCPYPLYTPPSPAHSPPPSPSAEEAKRLLSRIHRPEVAEFSTWV